MVQQPRTHLQFEQAIQPFNRFHQHLANVVFPGLQWRVGVSHGWLVSYDQCIVVCAIFDYLCTNVVPVFDFPR